MFTNQYVTYRRMLFTNETAQFTTCLGTKITPYSSSAYSNAQRDIGGDFRETVRFIAADSLAENTSSESKCYPGTYFGTGTTPATVDDIFLENVITAGISYRSSGYRLFKESEGLYVYELSYELTNTSDQNISISEMGIVRALSSPTNTVAYYPVLYDRTVLDTPIVVAPGETRLVTYRINFNQTLG